MEKGIGDIEDLEAFVKAWQVSTMHSIQTIKDQNACIGILLEAAHSDLFLVLDSIKRIVALQSNLEPSKRYTDMRAYHAELVGMREGLGRKLQQNKHRI